MGAVVREFLEETGLPSFPKVHDVKYYNWGKKGPHTRIFIAKTNLPEKYFSFACQKSEVTAHKFVRLSELGAMKCRNAKTFSLLRKPPTWKNGFRSSDGRARKTERLANFAGATMWNNRKVNIVVKSGKRAPKGFIWGPKSWTYKQRKQQAKKKPSRHRLLQLCC